MMNYFKMKRNEWKVKAQFYGMIAHVIDNQKDIFAMLDKLLVALKEDTTPDATQANQMTE